MKKKDKPDDGNKKEKKSMAIMQVELFDDGSVQVRDFPDAPVPAIQLLCAGIIEIAVYFINKATIDAEMKHSSRILTADNSTLDMLNKAKNFKDGLKI